VTDRSVDERILFNWAIVGGRNLKWKLNSVGFYENVNDATSPIKASISRPVNYVSTFPETPCAMEFFFVSLCSYSWRMK